MENEGFTDEPKSPGLPNLAGAGQFPEHDGARSDLNQAVQTKSGECDGPGRNRGIRQHDDPYDVPPERGAFESDPAPAIPRRRSASGLR